MRINSEKVAWKDVGNEVVVINLDLNEQLVFNETSRALWLALADGCDSKASLFKALQEQFSDVPDDETLERDVSKFLDAMTSKGLICDEEAA